LLIFLEGFKYFYWNRIASSGNYNYSIIGGEVQGGRFVLGISWVSVERRVEKIERESKKISIAYMCRL